MRRRDLCAVLCAAAWLGGCDLVDDVAAVTVCSGEEQVDIDLSPLAILASGAVLPQVPCGADGDCSGAETLCGDSTAFPCEVSCLGPRTAGDLLCDVSLSATLEQGVEVSLANELNRKLQSAPGEITLSRVEYSVLANSLTVDVPQSEVLVGSQSATDTSDGSVVLLATLPEIAAGETSELQTIVTTPDGRTAITTYAENYETPFRVFVRTTVTVASGDALPTGSMSLAVKACFKATP